MMVDAPGPRSPQGDHPDLCRGRGSFWPLNRQSGRPATPHPIRTRRVTSGVLDRGSASAVAIAVTLGPVARYYRRTQFPNDFRMANVSRCFSSIGICSCSRPIRCVPNVCACDAAQNSTVNSYGRGPHAACETCGQHRPRVACWRRKPKLNARLTGLAVWLSISADGGEPGIPRSCRSHPASHLAPAAGAPAYLW